jgi:hypothetical protein
MFQITRFLTLLTTIYAILLFANYHYSLAAKEHEAEENIKIIEAVLIENFEQVERVLCSIGRRINEKSPSLNLAEIHQVFLQTSASQGYRDIFSWSLFDWVNLEGYQTVNTMFGIRKNPDLVAASRNYRHPSNESWKLILSVPAIGNPSNTYIIPVGVQIETKNRQRAGTVSAGISIKKLVNAVVSRIDKNSRFLVIDNRNEQLVFGSYDIGDNPKQNFSDVFLEKLPVPKSNEYLLSKNMAVTYPYTIKVGYDKKQLWREVRFSSVQTLIQITAIALIILLFVGRKKVKTPV